MEHHHFLWENQLFLWQFCIAMLVYQRVYDSWIIGAELSANGWILIGMLNVDFGWDDLGCSTRQSKERLRVFFFGAVPS